MRCHDVVDEVEVEALACGHSVPYMRRTIYKCAEALPEGPAYLFWKERCGEVPVPLDVGVGERVFQLRLCTLIDLRAVGPLQQLLAHSVQRVRFSPRWAKSPR